MCGRYTVATDPAELSDRFDVELPADWDPSWNVAPTQLVPGLVRGRDEVRELRLLRFGLVPHWAKDTKGSFSLINARAETVRSRSAYRGLLERRRALIIADGFYEWRTDPDGRRRPVRFTVGDGEPFAFAGLWSSWKDPESGELAELVQHHHDHRERARRPRARPHAGDPAAGARGRLARPVAAARGGRRAARPVPGERDGPTTPRCS